MSSYFDTMAQCVADPWALVDHVYDTYERYLRDVSLDALVREMDKLADLQTTFYALKEKATKREHYNPGHAIQELHTFAHEFGTARIRLRGGRYAGDNPR